MAIEPPPNIMTPGKIRGKLRTGAKTATKDQERDYLARFEALARDPSPLVPEWRGSGSDPFARTRRKLSRISAKRESEGWLKWYARGRNLPNAYASTLLVLKGGKIPSFASIKFQGRDVRFVLRGNGQRDKLVSIQNHEDPQVRLLGFLDVAKKQHVVLVSTDDEFFAQAAGDALPTARLVELLGERDVDARETDGPAACTHTDEPGAVMRYEVPDVKGKVRLCRDCVELIGGNLEAALERNILAPAGRLRIERFPGGHPFRVHPVSGQAGFDAVVEQAGREALHKAKDYEQVTDIDLLDWAQEGLLKRLDERSEGYLLVGDELWLSDFASAAQRFGSTDLERAALAAAFQLVPPRLKTSDPSLSKLLAAAWKERPVDILKRISPVELPPADLTELAHKSPSDALPALARRAQTQERFRNYPAYEELPPALRLAYDLFRARRTDDPSLFQARLAVGVQGRETRSLALALARVFNAAAGLEWQYAPHEKDEAQFLEPFARELNLSTPATFHESLGKLAQALNLPAPRRAA